MRRRYRWRPRALGSRSVVRGHRERETIWASGRRAPIPSVHLTGSALPVRRPELELLDLAGRGAGKRAVELDGRRALVVGEVAPAVVDELALSGPSSGMKDDERL